MDAKEEEKQNGPAHATPNVQEITRKAKQFYDTLKTELEPTNNGKYIALEVNSKRYFIGETRDEAVIKARVLFPREVLFVKRIGEVEKTYRHFPFPRFKYARIF